MSDGLPDAQSTFPINFSQGLPTQQAQHHSSQQPHSVGSQPGLAGIRTPEMWSQMQHRQQQQQQQQQQQHSGGELVHGGLNLPSQPQQHVIASVEQNRENLQRAAQDQSGFRAGITSTKNAPLDYRAQVNEVSGPQTMACPPQVIPGHQQLQQMQRQVQIQGQGKSNPLQPRPMYNPPLRPPTPQPTNASNISIDPQMATSSGGAQNQGGVMSVPMIPDHQQLQQMQRQVQIQGQGKSNPLQPRPIYNPPLRPPTPQPTNASNISMDPQMATSSGGAQNQGGIMSVPMIPDHQQLQQMQRQVQIQGQGKSNPLQPRPIYNPPMRPPTPQSTNASNISMGPKMATSSGGAQNQGGIMSVPMIPGHQQLQQMQRQVQIQGQGKSNPLQPRPIYNPPLRPPTPQSTNASNISMGPQMATPSGGAQNQGGIMSVPMNTFGVNSIASGSALPQSAGSMKIRKPTPEEVMAAKRWVDEQKRMIFSREFDGVACYPTIPENEVQEYHRNLERLDQVLSNIEKYIHIAFAALGKRDVVERMFAMMASARAQLGELEKPNRRYVLELHTIRGMIQEADNMDKSLMTVLGIISTGSMMPSLIKDHQAQSNEVSGPQMMVRLPQNIPNYQEHPERLHPTLSSWLNNMNKHSGLIDRLEGLACAAPSDYRPQLDKQVAALRKTYKSQRERCIQFLQLTEEYADRYLLDISDEIQQQSSFLDILERRLDRAKALYRQATDLRKLYETGTVNVMEKARKTVLSRPLPVDFDLFEEVDSVLREIRRCYEDLDKFWIEEICRAGKAFEIRYVDPGDVERWRGFKASLEQTIESWKISEQDSHIRSTLCNNLPSSLGADLGAIASSLSPALGKLEKLLQKIRDSASVGFSRKSLGRVLQVNLGLAQNSKQCLNFFRCCVDFGDILVASSAAFTSYLTFPRVRASSDLRERVGTLGVEAVDSLAEEPDAPRFQGMQRFSSTHAKCLSLQRKTISDLNALIELVSSWVVILDGPPNALPGGVSPRSLHDVAGVWQKTRYSIRVALATLMGDPAKNLHHYSSSMTPKRPRSSLMRWMLNLVCFI